MCVGGRGMESKVKVFYRSWMRRGCVSPWLFNIVMDGFMRDMKAEVV